MTNVPAYLLASRSGDYKYDQLVGNLGAPAQPYISIKGNRFTLIDSDGGEQAITTVDQKTGMFYMDVAIVDWLERESRVYYAGAFDPAAANFAPPDCWSDNGVGPSRTSSNPQSHTCAACPQAEWGSKVSKVSGKGVPACGKFQKLAIMIPGDAVNFLLRVPPNSLKNLRDYVLKFKTQPFRINEVTTRISFAKDTLGTLTFVATGFLDETTTAQRVKQGSGPAVDMLVGRGDLPREGAAALLAPATQQFGVLGVAGLPAATAAFAPQPLPQGALAPPAQPAPVEAPKGRGRPRKAAEPTTAGQAEPTTAGQAAPFAEQPSQAPNGQAGGAAFGITQGVEPHPDLSNALTSFFGR